MREINRQELEQKISVEQKSEKPQRGVVIYSAEYKDKLTEFYAKLQEEEKEGGITSAPSGKRMPEKLWLALNQKNEVVGTIGLDNCENGIGYVGTFFVEKGVRGRRIGGKLLKEMANSVKEGKFKKLFSATMPNNNVIHEFHRKHGFKETDSPPDTLPVDSPFRSFSAGTKFFEIDLDENK